MKYDETLVNQAKVGDLVYGYDDLDELREAIEGDDEENLCKSVELVRNVAGIKIVYDCKTDSFHQVEYVYPISEAVEESRIERMLRILARSALDTGYRPLVIEQFFKLKKRGLINNPENEKEENAIECTYDLKDDEDCINLGNVIFKHKLGTVIDMLSCVDNTSRYVFIDNNLHLKDIEYSDSMFKAVRSLLLGFYDSIA